MARNGPGGCFSMQKPPFSLRTLGPRATLLSVPCISTPPVERLWLPVLPLAGCHATADQACAPLTGRMAPDIGHKLLPNSECHAPKIPIPATCLSLLALWRPLRSLASAEATIYVAGLAGYCMVSAAQAPHPSRGAGHRGTSTASQRQRSDRPSNDCPYRRRPGSGRCQISRSPRLVQVGDTRVRYLLHRQKPHDHGAETRN